MHGDDCGTAVKEKIPSAYRMVEKSTLVLDRHLISSEVTTFQPAAYSVREPFSVSCWWKLAQLWTGVMVVVFGSFCD